MECYKKEKKRKYSEVASCWVHCYKNTLSLYYYRYISFYVLLSHTGDKGLFFPHPHTEERKGKELTREKSSRASDGLLFWDLGEKPLNPYNFNKQAMVSSRNRLASPLWAAARILGLRGQGPAVVVLLEQH